MEKDVVSCTECGSTALIRDQEVGEVVCERCGFVIASILVYHGPEWRAFNEEQRKERTRVGAPIAWTMHDKGLSTVIDWRDRDVYGKKLSSVKVAWVHRLRKWDRRFKVSDSVERNLAYGLSELTKWTYKLNLPKNVLDTAAVLYRQVVHKRLSRGRSIQGIAAATLYIACRQCNVIRSLAEIAKATNISKKEGGRNYRLLLRRLQTKIPNVDPQKYVSKLVNQLSLSGDTEIIALKIIDQAVELKLTSGRGPAGMAAAATYMASVLTDERRTQGEIASGVGVTEVTIRNRYKELIQKLNINVDV